MIKGEIHAMGESIDLTNIFLNQLLAGKNVEDLAQELSNRLNKAVEQYDEEKAKREEEKRIAATTKEQAVQNIIDDIALLLSLYGCDMEKIFDAMNALDAKKISEELDDLIPLWRDVSNYIEIRETHTKAT